MSDSGTLYVLSNVDGSLAKVGMTRNGRPEIRADAYAREHGIRWHVYWMAVTKNVAAAEAAAHRSLQDRRFSLTPEAREIFHITPQHAQRIAERYVLAPAGTSTPVGNPHIPDLSLANSSIWPLCREALVAAAVGLARAFGSPTRGPVRSAALRMLARYLRR